MALIQTLLNFNENPPASLESDLIKLLARNIYDSLVWKMNTCKKMESLIYMLELMLDQAHDNADVQVKSKRVSVAQAEKGVSNSITNNMLPMSIVCKFCNQIGHYSDQCIDTDNAGKLKIMVEKRMYFRCAKAGHLAPQCRLRMSPCKLCRNVTHSSSMHAV